MPVPHRRDTARRSPGRPRHRRERIAPDSLVDFRTGAEEKRKTINGDDLIFALQNLGFEEYVPPLQSYLAQYRRVSKQKEKE